MIIVKRLTYNEPNGFFVFVGGGELMLFLKKFGFENILVSVNYNHGKSPANGDHVFSFEARRMIDK